MTDVDWSSIKTSSKLTDEEIQELRRSQGYYYGEVESVGDTQSFYIKKGVITGSNKINMSFFSANSSFNVSDASITLVGGNLVKLSDKVPPVDDLSVNYPLTEFLYHFDFSLEYFYYYWTYQDLTNLRDILQKILSSGASFGINQDGSNLSSNGKLVSQYLEEIFDKYFNNPVRKEGVNGFSKPADGTDNPIITFPGRSEYTEIQRNLHSIFRQTRGVANDFIAKVCVNGDYFGLDDSPTREFISGDQAIINWCGCFAPKPNLPDSEADIDKECDPLCQNLGAIKLVDSNGVDKECNGLLCILDDITLSGDGSGDVSISQVCPQCINGGQCRCIVDVTIPGVLNKISASDGSSMADDAVFKQYCPGAECIQIDPITRQAKVVECGQGFDVQTQVSKPGKIFWIISGLFFFILLIFVLASKSS